MPKPKRRKNLFGFGRKKSSGNFIPASGGIAAHSAKRKSAKASAGASDSKLDDVAKSLAKGKKYASLSSSEQAMVRRVASKMNPKRAMKIYDLYWSPTGQKIATVQASTAKAAKRKAPKPYSKYKGEIYTEDRGTVSNPKRKRNAEIGLPKNQFVNAKVRLKGGKVQIMADESVLGKAGFKGSAGLRGVSVKGGAKLNPSYRKTKKAAKKAQQAGLLEAGPMFQKWRKHAKVSKTGKKRNPPKTQFVVEWGAGTNFFNTLKSAKKFIGGLRSRGLLYGRYVKIVKMEPDKPSKTVFEKEY